jgi:hypothetical protein
MGGPVPAYTFVPGSGSAVVTNARRVLNPAFFR